jgi:hypothetical protein
MRAVDHCGPEVLLAAPIWLVERRSADRGDHDTQRPVAVDACVAPAVKALWDAGFVTLGSCCGHGELGSGPSLVLGEHERNYQAIRTTIATTDDRYYELLQWRLVNPEGLEPC